MGIFRLPGDNRRYYVYAMLCQDGNGPGYVKFGMSMRIGTRLSALRLGCPIPARYFAVAKMAGQKQARVVEAALHKRFVGRRMRKRGEWYGFDFDNPKDKADFNEGCARVFADHAKGWWTKVSVASLDEHVNQIQKSYLSSKGRQIRFAMEQREQKAQKELSEYGYT